MKSAPASRTRAGRSPGSPMASENDGRPGLQADRERVLGKRPARVVDREGPIGAPAQLREQRPQPVGRDERAADGAQRARLAGRDGQLHTRPRPQRSLDDGDIEPEQIG